MWVTSVHMRREDRTSISSRPLADLGRQLNSIRMLTPPEACLLQRCGCRPKHPMRCVPVCWRARWQGRCGAVASWLSRRSGRPSQASPNDRADAGSHRRGHPTDRPAGGKPKSETADDGVGAGRSPAEYGMPAAAQSRDVDITQARNLDIKSLSVRQRRTDPDPRHRLNGPSRVAVCYEAHHEARALVCEAISAFGPSPPWCDVRDSVAIGAKADLTRTSDFSRD
jgi:hypothetical protein